MADAPKRKRTGGTRVGNGAGWGGPAKGTGSGNAKQAFGAGTNAQGHSKATPIEAGNKRALRTEQAEELKSVLYDLAKDVTQPGATRVQAVSAFIDRVEGKPVATQVSLKSPAEEMDDAQLSRTIDAIRLAIAGGAESVGSGAEGEDGSQQAPSLRPLH